MRRKPENERHPLTVWAVTLKLFTTHANNEDVRETIEDLIEEAGSGDDGFSSP